MHHTFVKPASAVALASIIISIHAAAVAPRQAVPSGGFECVHDVYFKALFDNSDMEVINSVQNFCSQDLDLVDATICETTSTATTWVFTAGTSVISTTTATTTSYDSTVTVTETGTVLGLPMKMKARDAAPAPEAQITAAPKFVRDLLEAHGVEKRQSSAGFDVGSALKSACECGYLEKIVTVGTSYQGTCFPYTTVSALNPLCVLN